MTSISVCFSSELQALLRQRNINKRRIVPTRMHMISTFLIYGFTAAALAVTFKSFRDKKQNVKNEHGADSTSGNERNRDPPLEPKHKIFLSHSGAQKSFVEQLCLDLERVHHFPFFDKRTDSLPKGEKFPKLILQAAQQCQVAVVVLSEEYFTRSKWPMLELNAFVQSQKSGNVDLKILPLFYAITQAECCDRARQSRWLRVWRGWARRDSRIDVTQWEEALKVFNSTNGLQYVQAIGEVAYRKEVVTALCRLVIPEVKWDDSHVKGRSRICKAIAQKFEETQPSKDNVRVVGLYGMGGIGKTTICKSLCNEFFEEFNGKVCHAELEKKSVAALQIDMLKQLSDMNHDVLEGLNNDKSRHLLMEKIGRQEIFLAIDNVWDTQKSLGQALEFLRLDFRQGSKVMVTARTLDILKLLNINEGDCLEMPDLKEEEATTLFLHHMAFTKDFKNSDNDWKIIKECIKHSYFCKERRPRFVYDFDLLAQKEYHYHPLALKVLGVYCGSLGPIPSEWAEEKLHKLKENLNGFREKVHPIFSILRTSYDLLLPEEQLLFMDVILFSPMCSMTNEISKPSIIEWLTIVHRKDKNEIKDMLKALKTKSLLEDFGDHILSYISIHDLYLEFAELEAKAGVFDRRRWIRETKNVLIDLVKTPPGICWPYLERIEIFDNVLTSLEETKLHLCSNVVAMKLSYCRQLRLINLQGLDRLTSLELKSCFDFRGIRGLKAVQNLAWLRCIECSFPPVLGDFGILTKLQVLELRGGSSHLKFPPMLDGCINLRNLTMVCHPCLTEFPNLSKLVSLQKVHFEDCPRVKILSGLSSKLSKLQHLSLVKCVKIQSIPHLNNVVSLEELNLSGCKGLTQLPNLNKLKNLKVLNISECNFKDLPYVGNIVNLEELNCSSSKITELSDLGNLKQLRELNLQLCNHLTNLSNIGELPALRHLNVGNCPKLVNLPDLTGSKDLSSLYMWATDVKVLPNDFPRLVKTCKSQLMMGDSGGLVIPLLQLLKEEVSMVEQEAALHALRSCYWKKPSRLSHAVVTHLVKLVGSGCKGACDLLSTICWPDFDGFYTLARDYGKYGVVAVGKVTGGADLVIKALCENEDLGNLSFVVAALASTGDHWNAIKAPSTIHALTHAIVRHLTSIIDDEHVFKATYLTIPLRVHKALVTLTADIPFARMLGEKGIDHCFNRLLWLFHNMNDEGMDGLGFNCRIIHDKRVIELKEKLVAEVEKALMKTKALC